MDLPLSSSIPLNLSSLHQQADLSSLLANFSRALRRNARTARLPSLSAAVHTRLVEQTISDMSLPVPVIIVSSDPPVPEQEETFDTIFASLDSYLDSIDNNTSVNLGAIGTSSCGSLSVASLPALVCNDEQGAEKTCSQLPPYSEQPASVANTGIAPQRDSTTESMDNCQHEQLQKQRADPSRANTTAGSVNNECTAAATINGDAVIAPKSSIVPTTSTSTSKRKSTTSSYPSRQEQGKKQATGASAVGRKSIYYVKDCEPLLKLNEATMDDDITWAMKAIYRVVTLCRGDAAVLARLTVQAIPGNFVVDRHPPNSSKIGNIVDLQVLEDAMVAVEQDTDENSNLTEGLLRLFHLGVIERAVKKETVGVVVTTELRKVAITRARRIFQFAFIISTSSPISVFLIPLFGFNKATFSNSRNPNKLTALAGLLSCYQWKWDDIGIVNCAKNEDLWQERWSKQEQLDPADLQPFRRWSTVIYFSVVLLPSVEIIFNGNLRSSMPLHPDLERLLVPFDATIDSDFHFRARIDSTVIEMPEASLADGHKGYKNADYKGDDQKYMSLYNGKMRYDYFDGSIVVNRSAFFHPRDIIFALEIFAKIWDVPGETLSDCPLDESHTWPPAGMTPNLIARLQALPRLLVFWTTHCVQLKSMELNDFYANRFNAEKYKVLLTKAQIDLCRESDMALCLTLDESII